MIYPSLQCLLQCCHRDDFLVNIDEKKVPFADDGIFDRFLCYLTIDWTFLTIAGKLESFGGKTPWTGKKYQNLKKSNRQNRLLFSGRQRCEQTQSSLGFIYYYPSGHSEFYGFYHCTPIIIIEREKYLKVEFLY
uniref:Uncharacterized protein n=1 Tax=Cacopsylla melanoneura TaxID=428564 RepID=A0A8D8ZFD9_9HEMI